MSKIASIIFLLTILILLLKVILCHSSLTPLPSYKLPPNQLDPTTLNIWTNQPQCKSANAQVYFLPTQPKPAKVTVLTEPTKVIPEVPKISQEIGDITPKLGVLPPPPSSPVLPGVLDTIPTMIPAVEATCPCLNRKSKILEKIFERTSSVLPNSFHYDQDLLDGFLSSLGF